MPKFLFVPVTIAVATFWYNTSMLCLENVFMNTIKHFLNDQLGSTIESILFLLRRISSTWYNTKFKLVFSTLAGVSNGTGIQNVTGTGQKVGLGKSGMLYRQNQFSWPDSKVMFQISPSPVQGPLQLSSSRSVENYKSEGSIQ